MLRRSGIHEVDVAVLGGGPAGAATSLTLSRHGHSAVVIEQSHYRSVRIGEMLPPAARPLLASLGLLDRFLAENHSRSFAVRSAWGQPNLYDNDFIFNPHGSGWHIDRARFDAMLARAAEDAGACVCRGRTSFHSRKPERIGGLKSRQVSPACSTPSSRSTPRDERRGWLIGKGRRESATIIWWVYLVLSRITHQTRTSAIIRCLNRLRTAGGIRLAYQTRM
jgi:hypothetical protein